MPLRVNTNLPAVTIQRTSKANNRDLSVRIQRLASALRVNQAADDAARLATSEGIRTEGTFQIGPDGGETDRIEIDLGNLRTGGPAVNLGGTSVASLQGAQDAISHLDAGIARVTEGRADIGALQNRLAFAIRTNESAIENVQASESSIRDADVAEEVSAFAHARILSRASTATLAQANVDSQRVLSLLGG